MKIYTIGYTKKSASAFFDLLKEHGIERLIDVRRHNTSQLAGFTKQSDFPYFLREIAGIDYVHELRFAPSEELFKAYRREKAFGFDELARRFREELEAGDIASQIDRALFDRPAVLLCSEADADECHRSVVASYLASEWGDVEVDHL